MSVFGLWPRVFFFIKARYQNAEEVLKHRWVLHGFSFVSVLVLVCWALWLVQNVHALSRLWSCSEKQPDQAPALRKPRKPSRPAKPVYLYRITESCIHLKCLVWSEPLFICEWKNSVIIMCEILLWLSGFKNFSGPSRNGPQVDKIACYLVSFCDWVLLHSLLITFRIAFFSPSDFSE